MSVEVEGLLYLIRVDGCECSLDGPFDNFEDRLEAAREFYNDDPDVRTVHWLDLCGKDAPTAGDFSNRELAEDEPRDELDERLSQVSAMGFDRSFSDSKSVTIRCSQCAACVVNGVPIHESGCPNEKHECHGCNSLVPRGVKYCEDCQ